MTLKVRLYKAPTLMQVSVRTEASIITPGQGVYKRSEPPSAFRLAGGMGSRAGFPRLRRQRGRNCVAPVAAALTNVRVNVVFVDVEKRLQLPGLYVPVFGQGDLWTFSGLQVQAICVCLAAGTWRRR